MTISNEFVLRALAEQLPARINAARHNGLDCVRLTLAEAQSIRGVIPRELADLDAAIVGARKGGER
ncbi:MAG: hypothetical protein L0G94_10520 [Brachybacterium sp.]|uniref:hypothetical protein n=1 Tax=Brachybacterium sp. TaxID=1891286 RepID=UPI00264834A6|nr:hypothetical protein [Brachybacterium sp.]MDN5687089.1 hypothetical protein [Brachybacterium sp.]